MNCSSKIVVFDLDETLGYFVEFGMFWDSLKNYYKHTLNKDKDKDKDKNLIFDQTFFYQPHSNPQQLTHEAG